MTDHSLITTLLGRKVQSVRSVRSRDSQIGTICAVWIWDNQPQYSIEFNGKIKHVIYIDGNDYLLLPNDTPSTAIEGRLNMAGY